MVFDSSSNLLLPPSATGLLVSKLGLCIGNLTLKILDLLLVRLTVEGRARLDFH